MHRINQPARGFLQHTHDLSSDQSMIKVAESARTKERDQILQSHDHNQDFFFFFFEGQSVAFGLEGSSSSTLHLSDEIEITTVDSFLPQVFDSHISTPLKALVI